MIIEQYKGKLPTGGMRPADIRNANQDRMDYERYLINKMNEFVEFVNLSLSEIEGKNQMKIGNENFLSEKEVRKLVSEQISKAKIDVIESVKSSVSKIDVTKDMSEVKKSVDGLADKLEKDHKELQASINSKADKKDTEAEIKEIKAGFVSEKRFDGLRRTMAENLENRIKASEDSVKKTIVDKFSNAFGGGE